MGFKRTVKSFLMTIILFVTVLFITRLFISGGQVSGDSMEPTLSNSQRLIVVNDTAPKRGDIVVFKVPDGSEESYVKRVIGLPGDTVEMKQDQLFVNGQVVDEPYFKNFKKNFELNYGKQYNDDFSLLTKTGRSHVPPYSYFVLGDNRPVSKDSRSFGFVPQENLEGVVKLRYLPFNKIKIF